MLCREPPAQRPAVSAALHRPEDEAVEALLSAVGLDPAARRRIEVRAREWVEAMRARRKTGLDAFLAEYDLTTPEGVQLMCLAEALLRVPDAQTVDRLLADKLGGADWARHLGDGRSLFVNAGTWGLMLAGRLVELKEAGARSAGEVLGRLAARLGEPVVRAAVREAMAILARQFVLGRDMEEALQRVRREGNDPRRYSFDMLGEAALTMDDAARHRAAYEQAIEALAPLSAPGAPVAEAPGISVKLSALHPRFEYAQRQRVLAELVPVVAALTRQARAAGLGLTIDAEEIERLHLTLDVFEAVYADDDALAGWDGLGIAVQAYHKAAPALVDHLTALARRHGRRIMLRLVKGAYWDTEIKRAQERGLDEYPVYTRKTATDVSYLVCARRILAAGEAFFPQFATHNAHTASAVLELAQGAPMEFQRLHGMGEALYAVADTVPCRVYAPVGSHEDLLPYLVRRLLENGANTSFVNRLAHERAPVETLVADPVRHLEGISPKGHPRLPPPPRLYGPRRRNSRGWDLTDPAVLAELDRDLAAAAAGVHHASPLVNGRPLAGPVREVRSPAEPERVVGAVEAADAGAVEAALACAQAAAPEWAATPPQERAAVLRRAADFIEAHGAGLAALVVAEGGRTVPNALDEVREAVDACRYYAQQLEEVFAPLDLPGPAGEANTLSLHGRGVFACISPWNFPLAIFTGQVVAALAAGNAVVAKPASATPLVADRVVRLLLEAGVPAEVLHCLPGPAAVVGEALVRDPRVAGVCFTGSTETARRLHRLLAARDGPIVPLIAETGGLNAMIVDSTALPEQVVRDVLASAFDSAGQRCSALRLLFLQDDTAARVLEMLLGAMRELRLGDPARLETDVGPLIDAAAREGVQRHLERMRREARCLLELPLPAGCGAGWYLGPAVFELDDPGLLRREVFGPVLHVVRYRAADLERVVEAVNATGYGLTLGVHSRIGATAEVVRRRARAGNVYVNRNMIGAVVGVQPFGGEGLSGTGPKAGGPWYLPRLAVERTWTVNTAAVGGNASLLALDDEDAGRGGGE